MKFEPTANGSTTTTHIYSIVHSKLGNLVGLNGWRRGGGRDWFVDIETLYDSLARQSIDGSARSISMALKMNDVRGVCCAARVRVFGLLAIRKNIIE